MNITKITNVAGTAAVVGLAITLALNAGCQKYQNYPVVPTSKGLAEDPSNPATEAAIVAAVQYVGNRYPPNGEPVALKPGKEPGKLMVDYPFALNLPAGMRKSFYERIPGKIGPSVVPLTPEVVEEGTLPIFHVTRVQLRFNSGIVDVLRPVPELGAGPDGKPIYQKFTVRLQGGFEPWRALHARAWDPGFDEAPPVYFVPDMERVEQFKYSTVWTPAQREEYDRGLLARAEPVVTPQEPLTVRVRPKMEVTDGVASEKHTD
ncbi:MAG TPA: hypothetical protein VD997_02690 [Phycisphaerales bacterium]|nr:hypothetical protein [Phycisphaerales bacterium]